MDLFSVAEVNGTYVSGLTVGARTWPCYSVQESQPMQTWNNISFPVPFPVEPYLVAKYGTTWTEKHKEDYGWAREPFKTENGRRHCFKEDMPELSDNI